MHYCISTLDFVHFHTKNGKNNRYDHFGLTYHDHVGGVGLERLVKIFHAVLFLPATTLPARIVVR